MNRSRIAITMGDPAGVGPEICLFLLQDPAVFEFVIPIIVGDRSVLEACAVRLDRPFTAPSIELSGVLHAQAAAVVDVKSIQMSDFQPGTINAATGKAAYTYVQTAIDLAMARSVDAVTTAPLNKEALFKAGIHFPGHTEIFAARTEVSRSCMMQYSNEITCSFVTVHIGYGEVIEALCSERILDVIQLTDEALRRIRKRRPKLVVCGLNPHAGEHGLFGNREEERIIVPAIEQALAMGMDVEGPVPPDTAFLPWKRQATDAFICMYHDQGHIPVKALAFDSAVNTTLGLPIIRTSVDHGTALDIAWQGLARTASMLSALRLASLLASDKKTIIGQK